MGQMAEKRRDNLIEITSRAGRREALSHAENVRKGGTPDALLDTMMSMLANRGGVLLAEEEAQFVPLLQNMAVRAEKIVRVALAQKVADLGAAPRGLYEFLVHDDIEVAEPILTKCVGLDDQLLIEVIEKKTADHARAISSRAQVSVTVSAAIIGGGDEDSIIILLNNTGAEITPPSFASIVQGADNRPQTQQALISRDDLPAVIAQQLFWMVGSGLRQRILERFPISEGEIDELISEAIEHGLAGPGAKQIREGAKHLLGSTTTALRLSVSEIIGHARNDRLEEFVSGVSARLGIRPSSIMKILNDQGGEALAVLCRALHADRTQFTSVLLKNDYKKFGMPRPPGQIEQLSKVYDHIRPENAHATVQMWDALEPRAVA